MISHEEVHIPAYSTYKYCVYIANEYANIRRWQVYSIDVCLLLNERHFPRALFNGRVSRQSVVVGTGVTIMYVSGINADCAAELRSERGRGKLIRINWPINIESKMYFKMCIIY